VQAIAPPVPFGTGTEQNPEPACSARPIGTDRWGAKSSELACVGTGHQFIDSHVGAVGCRPGDRFLVCSDGLVDGLWDRRIEEIACSAKPVGDLARLLVEEAVAESGCGNTTAVVVEVQAAAP
jgi:protein phosphatase